MAHRIVQIRPLAEPPAAPEENLRRFVPFYLTCLLARGPGELGAEPAPADEVVRWTFRSFVRAGDGRILASAAGAQEVVHELPRVLFRPVLARLAFALTSDENPYGGFGYFQVHVDGEPAPREALCCCYVANEPTIGTWARLHWYGPHHVPPEKLSDHDAGR
jgi:hypothetical protein